MGETETTFNEHGEAMQNKISGLMGSVADGAAKRDLAIANTHLEDALTRFNSAIYRLRGTWKRNDPEKDEVSA